MIQGKLNMKSYQSKYYTFIKNYETINQCRRFPNKVGRLLQEAVATHTTHAENVTFHRNSMCIGTISILFFI